MKRNYVTYIVVFKNSKGLKDDTVLGAISFESAYKQFKDLVKYQGLDCKEIIMIQRA